MALPVSDPEELVSHAGTTPHDLAKDGDDKKVFVALLSGKDCECLWLQDRTIRQLKEEAQQKLDIAIKHLIGPDMEPLDEEKMLAEENVMPGTTLTVVAVNQAAEDEKEAAECGNDIVAAAFYGHLGGVRHLLRRDPGAVAATDVDAEGPRRRGRDGRRLGRHRAAPGGVRRPRGDVLGTAGGGGRGGRRGRRWQHPAAFRGEQRPRGGGEAARRGESFRDCERQEWPHSIGRCTKRGPR